MSPERGTKSKVEELLDSFKNPNTGHIEINPRSAHNVLYDSLLAHYRGHFGQNAVVEILAQIAERSGEDLIDFTKELEGYEKKRIERDMRDQELLEHGKIIGPRTPPQPEI